MRSRRELRGCDVKMLLSTSERLDGRSMSVRLSEESIALFVVLLSHIVRIGRGLLLIS